MNLQALKEQSASVPCGTCRACCKQDTIVLSEVDDHTTFEWHLEGGKKVLNRKPNGECIYLDSKGCSIHDRLPNICKRFDCRVLFLTTPKTLRKIRIMQNPTMREVYSAGKARLSTLKVSNG